jgi:hypothetical protein
MLDGEEKCDTIQSYSFIPELFFRTGSTEAR